MANERPPVSPDGAYWWDGQAWRPMFQPDLAGPAQPPPPAIPEAPPASVPRPSWLPEGVDMPAEPASTVAAPAAVGAYGAPPAQSTAYAPPPGAPAAPWTPPSQRPTATGSMLLVVAGFAVLLVVVVGTGLWVLTHQPTTVSDLTSSASPSAIVSQTISPSPSPVTAGPLTADLAGDYCPVAHRGDSACWKGAAINTGPPIGKLALIFILGAPYANWFANHSSAALSGFYTSPGCEIDAPQVRILCGSVGPGQEVDVYLGGDVSKRGTFTYAVKFADVSSGSPVYINEHPDGTHDIVTWREVIS